MYTSGTNQLPPGPFPSLNFTVWFLHFWNYILGTKFKGLLESLHPTSSTSGNTAAIPPKSITIHDSYDFLGKLSLFLTLCQTQDLYGKEHRLWTRNAWIRILTQVWVEASYWTSMFSSFLVRKMRTVPTSQKSWGWNTSKYKEKYLCYRLA